MSGLDDRLEQERERRQTQVAEDDQEQEIEQADTRERTRADTGEITDDADARRMRKEAADTRGGSREETDSRTELFEANRASELRDRWSDVQTRFVDDPRAAVKEADGLVEDVVEQLTKQFADERTRLESQWGRDEKVSTEELRLALRRYREFFERLLSV